MIKVYVAGAYSDDNVLGVLRNIGRGEQEAANLFSMGYAPFTPWHDKDFILKNPYAKFDVKQFQEYSMEWLRLCDVVLIVPNVKGLKDWKHSKGTLAEIEEANKLKIPVVFSFEQLLNMFPIEVDTTQLFG